MIIGIGSDLCNIDRITRSYARFGQRFLNRIFTQQEIAKAESRKNRIETYAKRFAAKEACAKALGTGIGFAGVRWNEIEITNGAGGRPEITLKGKAHEKLLSLIPSGYKPMIHLTMSDEPPLAQAFVIIEARSTA